MAKSALLLGGTGQIGRATARLLEEHGWEVTVAARTPAPGVLTLDREDTGALLAAADGRDLVLDTVAYTAAHGAQLTGLAGRVGSLVVISTASVYRGENGSYLDVAGERGFPTYPEGRIPESHPTTDDPEDGYSTGKAALERVLLAADGLPVTVLRPGAIHGPHSQLLREWFFVKRALDGRRAAVLAYDGQSRFSTSSTVNLAELVRLAGERPGRRVLNAVDDEGLSSREIGETVFGVLGHEAEIVGLPGAPRDDDLGANPWGVPSPLLLDMTAAREQLGYVAVPYAQTVPAAIEWMLDAVRADPRPWHEVFPRYFERYGAQSWFPYQAEDAYLSERP
jgi:nucleoside-diphosphate-sugar epimerase